MSEANIPSSPQGQPESESALDPTLDFDINQIFDASELDKANFEESLAKENSDYSSVTHTPPAHSSAEANSIAAANLSSIAAWSQDVTQPESDALPNLADLISLIQELNQCNGVLMDRVSQLEEALESSQNALQDEVGRTQDAPSQDWTNAQDWATVQDQVTNLFNQLEFAHQTNQRQQILIETVTGQLENSQERVAQLEREAALIQQRYNEQSQQLVKAEHTSRDLQARLQRQQRYTLQFKAALEKSLEVPTPHYELGQSESSQSEAGSITAAAPDMALQANALFLPKAKQIQPWSAQAKTMAALDKVSGDVSGKAAGSSAWMKLQQPLLEVPLPLRAKQSEMLAEEPEHHHTEHHIEPNYPAPNHLAQPAAKPTAQPNQPESLPAAPSPAHLDLPSFGMPSQFLEPAIAQELVQELAGQDLAGSDSDDSQAVPQAMVQDPVLRHQLDQVVKPLADMLAEALLPDRGQSLEQAQPAQLPAPTQQSQPEPQLKAGSDADQLLASVMADAEDALWQDLARLIDVSTEDVVKASLAGDLAAFESIDFAALSPIPAEPVVEAAELTAELSNGQPAVNKAVSNKAVNNPVTAEPARDAAAVAPLLRRMRNPAQAAAPEPASTPDSVSVELEEENLEPDQTAPALATSSWPSPVVYPLRPVRKRDSLAMVDLPTFPRA